MPSSIYKVPPWRITILKLWLPPKVWFHGSQSISTGADSARNGQHWRIACWFEHIMRWVLITPLGRAVEPEVNRILATVPGRTAAKAASTSGPGVLVSNEAKLAEPAGGLMLVTTSTRASSGITRASAKRAPSWA